MKKKFLNLFNERAKDVFLMGILAVALLFTAWKIFQEDERASTSVALSDNERKVTRILQEIDGVGEASVIVCEEEEAKSVVIVCEGANDLRVIMDIREAVSALLNIEQKSIKIYLKKE